MHHFTFLDSNEVGVPLREIYDCAVNVARANKKQTPLGDGDDYAPGDQIVLMIVRNIAYTNDGKTIEEAIAKHITSPDGELIVDILRMLRDKLNVRSFSCYRE